MEPFVVLVFLVVVLLLFFFFYFIPIRLWVAAITARVPVSLFSLIGMRLRRVPPSVIVNPLISAVKAGLTLNTDQLEAHYLAGGNVFQVVNALISADKANIPLGFERAAAIDLAGRDVLEAVHMSVKPKVIDAPDPSQGPSLVAAVAVDKRDKRHLLVVSEKGMGKRTPLAEYPRKGRRAQGVITMRVTDRTGPVVGADVVDEDDEILCITAQGVALRCRVSDIRVTGRAAQGVRIVRPDEGDRVTAVAKVVRYAQGAES